MIIIMERIEFIVKVNSKDSRDNLVFVFKNFHELDDFLSKYWLVRTDSLSLIVRFYYYSRRPVDFLFTVNPGDKFKYQKRHRININDYSDNTYFYVFGVEKPDPNDNKFIYYDIKNERVSKSDNFNKITF